MIQAAPITQGEPIIQAEPIVQAASSIPTEPIIWGESSIQAEASTQSTTTPEIVITELMDAHCCRCEQYRLEVIEELFKIAETYKGGNKNLDLAG